MTIVIAIKVANGFALAADSATTASTKSIDGTESIDNIYNNSNKIVNLHKSLPIGLLTWGMAQIGQLNIANHSKFIRSCFDGSRKSELLTTIDPENYKLEDIFKLVSNYFENQLKNLIDSGKSIGTFGFMICGYSGNSIIPEAYAGQSKENGNIEQEDPYRGNKNIVFYGQPDVLTRLIDGYTMFLEEALIKIGVKNDVAKQIHELLPPLTHVPLVNEFMPIEDAVELAYFLANTTSEYTRFRPGGNTVGGPIDLAAITPFETFKWVQRKHYFNIELNPGGENGK